MSNYTITIPNLPWIAIHLPTKVAAWQPLTGSSRRGRGLPDEDVGEAALCLRFRLRAQQRRRLQIPTAKSQPEPKGVIREILGENKRRTRELHDYYGEGSYAAEEGVGVGVVAPALGHRRDLIRPRRPRLLPGEQRFGCPHQEEA